MSFHKPFDAELDQLLSQAQWPRPGAERIARLAAEWRRLRAARRRRRIALAASAVTASLALFVAVVAWPEPAVPPAKPLASANSAARTKPLDIPLTMPDNPTPASPEVRSGVAPRDPNSYERVLLVRMMSAPRKPTPAAAAAKQLDENAVEELIAALAQDPNLDVQSRLPAARHAAKWEQAVARRARQGTEAQRFGAARWLSQLGTRRSLDVLGELAARPATHEAAILGLARLSTDRNLAQLASQERDIELKCRLLQRLLERRTPDAVASYLSFIKTPAVPEKVLEVAAQMNDPPVEQLLAYLEGPNGTLRLSAALVLARLSDPAVAERLCESVWGIGRQEALIALLLSRSEQAAVCLTHARENLYLVASLQAAEQALNSLYIPTRGGLP